jgi:hypothetical protein
MGLNIFPLAPSGGITSTYAADLPPGTLASVLNSASARPTSASELVLQHSLSERLN